MAATHCPRCGRVVPLGARTCPFDGTPVNHLFADDGSEDTAKRSGDPSGVQVSASLISSMASISDEVTGPALPSPA
jgi:hypothetical protein